MAVDITVPQLGESVTEGTIANWLKKVGDPVQVDEPLVELETDKVTLEVNASAAGVLAEISADTGSEVEVGAVIGKIDETGKAKGPAGQDKKPASHQEAPSDPKKQAEPEKPAEPEPATRTASDKQPGPAARKLIEEFGLNAANIPASGKDGRPTKADVLAHIEQQKQAVKQGAAGGRPAIPDQPSGPRPREDREEKVPMSRLRRRVAERLKEAQNTAAMLTTFNEVDLTELLAMRADYKERFEKKHGVKLGFMGFFVKACVQALKEFPAVNAEIDGSDIIYKNYYDVGVAVSTPNGLMVPVIRECDTKSFAEIEGDIAEYGKKARDGKIAMEDLTGGTFTISNGGVFGSLNSTPILNPPQSGILGMHKIQDRPVAVKGEVVIRPMMYLALSYDHRIIDGREAVSFLVRVKEMIEDPARLVLEV